MKKHFVKIELTLRKKGHIWKSVKIGLGTLDGNFIVEQTLDNAGENACNKNSTAVQ